MVILMHKSAREMFEDLGFKRYDTGQCIKYERINGDDIVDISFVIEIKELYINLYYVDTAVLKAINKQLKELRWLAE